MAEVEVSEVSTTTQTRWPFHSTWISGRSQRTRLVESARSGATPGHLSEL